MVSVSAEMPRGQLSDDQGRQQANTPPRFSLSVCVEHPHVPGRVRSNHSAVSCAQGSSWVAVMAEAPGHGSEKIKRSSKR